MGKNFIVVTAGLKPGVYRGWVNAAPLVVNIPGAIYSGYDSETEAFESYGRAVRGGWRRTLNRDGSISETPTRAPACAKQPEKRPRTVGACDNAKTEINEEIVVQCPPVSSPQPRSIIQRTSTLPALHTPRSPSNAVQRSKTVPDLDSRSMPSTPKNARVQKSQASSVSRSRVISISTDGSATDEEIPSSPATNVSSRLSPIFDRHPPLSPSRDTSLSPPPARKRDKCGGYRHHPASTPRSGRGSKVSGHATPGSPSKKATGTTGGSVRSTTQGGTSRKPHPLKRVVWDSPPTNRRGTHNATSHAPRDRNESRPRPPPSTDSSFQLTYSSGDEDPAGDLTRSTADTEYYTPSSRGSEISDAESQASGRVSPLKRKGKHRALPPPPSSSPPSHSGSSPRSASGRSHKKPRDRYIRPPNEQAPGQDPSQSVIQDACHCAGPCPSCHKQRLPFPPYYHPMMLQPFQYPHPYFPLPHLQTGYQTSHYGHSPYPYSFPILQHTDPLPSISSAQPIPSYPGYQIPPPAIHLPTAFPTNVPTCASPPAPTPLIPAPEPSSSAPIPSPPVGVSSRPPVPQAIEQVSPEHMEALGHLYQPPQRTVKVIDPVCDPRSPYSKKAVVPAFPNSPIVLGRPGTPLSPLDGLGFAL